MLCKDLQMVRKWAQSISGGTRFCAKGIRKSKAQGRSEQEEEPGGSLAESRSHGEGSQVSTAG